jgi:hypothetical protein
MSHSDSTRRSIQSDIIIRKPKQAKSQQGRTHISSDDVVKESTDAEGLPTATERAVSTLSTLSAVADIALDTPPPPEQRPDNLERIRALLRSPPIAGIENWGIPEPSTDPPEPAIEVRSPLAKSSLTVFYCSFVSSRPSSRSFTR